MSRTCISIISENIDPAQLNELYNSPNRNIGQLAEGVILETVALENFGIEENEYCADSVCLQNVTSENELCAIVLHECATGQMIDYQLNPNGVYCDEEDKIWVTLKCWEVQDNCEVEENKLDSFMALNKDPCRAVEFLRATLLETVTTQKVVSWSFAGKSVTLKNQNSADLYKLLCYYEGLCKQHKYQTTCCPQPTNSFRFVPDC